MWAWPTWSPALAVQVEGVPEVGVGVVVAAQPGVGPSRGRGGRGPGRGGSASRWAAARAALLGGGQVVPVPAPVEEVRRGLQASCQVWVSNPVAAAWSTAASSTGCSAVNQAMRLSVVGEVARGVDPGPGCG